MRLLQHCNVCGSSRLRPWAVSFAADALHRSMARCADCGMFCANPMCTEEELNSFYANSYYADSGAAMIRAFPGHVETSRSRIARDILPLAPPPGRFLEVGCGYGPVLIAARDLGYEVTGIELGDQAREWAAREHGLEMHGRILEECGFADASFDVIFAWHVIEHVPDMTRFLNEVRRVLKPGGIFFFGTENYRSLPIRVNRALHLLGGTLPGLDTADEHTFLFTPGLVRSLFPRFGFQVESAHAFQPHHKRTVFFAPARRGGPLKRAVHHAMLGVVYGLATALPGGGDHMQAAVRRLTEDPAL